MQNVSEIDEIAENCQFYDKLNSWANYDEKSKKQNFLIYIKTSWNINYIQLIKICE